MMNEEEFATMLALLRKVPLAFDQMPLPARSLCLLLLASSHDHEPGHCVVLDPHLPFIEAVRCAVYANSSDQKEHHAFVAEGLAILLAEGVFMHGIREGQRVLEFKGWVKS